MAAAQGEDGVGTVDAPVHPGSLASRTDRDLAASLDNARADAQADGPEVLVAHALAIGLHVIEALARLLAVPRVLAQGGEDRINAACVEFGVTEVCPGLGKRGVGAVDGLGDFAEVLLGVVEVEDLHGTGELLGGEPPDPGSSVADHDAPRGLATDALGEGGDFGVGVEAGRALDRGRVGDRAAVACRAAFPVAAFGHHTTTWDDVRETLEATERFGTEASTRS